MKNMAFQTSKRSPFQYSYPPVHLVDFVLVFLTKYGLMRLQQPPYNPDIALVIFDFVQNWNYYPQETVWWHEHNSRKCDTSTSDYSKSWLSAVFSEMEKSLENP